MDEQHLALEERVAQLGIELGHDVERRAAVARADPAGVGEHPELDERQLAPRQLVRELRHKRDVTVAKIFAMKTESVVSPRDRDQEVTLARACSSYHSF